MQNNLKALSDYDNAFFVVLKDEKMTNCNKFATELNKLL